MQLDYFSYFLYPLIFLLGLAMGSYLNAWIWRVRQGLWRWNGRSMCIGCSRQLAWFENIPLFSFIFLRGRCRTCRIQIPWSYFLVELTMGLLFVGLTYYHQEVIAFNQWHFVRDIIFAALLLVVFVYDAKYMEVLTGVVWSGSIIGFAINYFALGYSVPSLFIGFVIGGGFFWAQYVLSKGRWIGGGDVRLGVMMGLWLGFPHIIVALFVSYILGALTAIPLLMSHKKHMNSAIPFGTFLAVGTFITMLWGQQIVHWYAQFL